MRRAIVNCYVNGKNDIYAGVEINKYYLVKEIEIGSLLFIDDVNGNSISLRVNNKTVQYKNNNTIIANVYCSVIEQNYFHE